MMDLTQISAKLSREVDRLSFAPPVAYAYNPLTYAWGPHEEYLKRYGGAPKEILLVGMNPGPFGMAQTGVPFGDKTMVREWLGIEGAVGKPAKESPKRPVEGFACPRGEVSGTRLWGWARDRYGTPQKFFQRFFVWNYCPLAFIEASGRNRTPDKLPAAEREPLFAICDQALGELIEALGAKWLIGVGKFAEEQIRGAIANPDRYRIGSIPHPSPANPAANAGWARLADRAFERLGIPL
jgi:single-strand selective monofunctional uracil DNA glycosylase